MEHTLGPAERAHIIREIEHLREINAKLLRALEQALLFIEGAFPEPSPLLWQDLDYYRTIIEEANK